MTKCSQCKKPKRNSSFVTDNRRVSNRGTTCRRCAQANTRRWRTEHPEEKRASQKRSYHRRRTHILMVASDSGQLKRRGVSPAAYQALLQKQHGVCAICFQPPLASRKLCIDHNHITNKNRGLLCSQCNFVVGNSKENVVILFSAIEYLKHYSHF